MVVQLQVLNLVCPASLQMGKKDVLHSAILIPKFSLDFSLRHAEDVSRVNNFNSVCMGDSIVLDL